MDAPLIPGYDLTSPWRRATFVAGSFALLELLALLALGALLLTRAPSARPQSAPRVVSRTVVTKAPRRVHVAAPRALPGRRTLRVLVLNGNGRTGAAAGAAARLERLGYRIAGAANAARQNYAATLVMYAPGFRLEGLRLGHDVGSAIVGPLDGLSRADLHGGQLAVILGA
jgi:hypothetical protein